MTDDQLQKVIEDRLGLPADVKEEHCSPTSESDATAQVDEESVPKYIPEPEVPVETASFTKIPASAAVPA